MGKGARYVNGVGQNRPVPEHHVGEQWVVSDAKILREVHTVSKGPFSATT